MGVQFLEEAINFSLFHRIQSGPGVHPALNPMANGGPYPGHKADRSPASCAEVCNVSSYTSTLSHIFTTQCLIN
jgi:hypothetical protein